MNCDVAGRIIVMRGIQGAGKTFIAQRDFPDAIRLSSSDFPLFWKDEEYEENGQIETKKVFTFVPDKLTDSHKWNLKRCEEALIKGNKLIVIDNTNIGYGDFSLYVQMARSYRYKVEIINVICDPDIAFQRNIHNVPHGKIINNARLLDTNPMPPNINIKTILNN